MSSTQPYCNAIWTETVRAFASGTPITPDIVIEYYCDEIWNETVRALTTFAGGILTEDSHDDTSVTLSWTSAVNNTGTVDEQLQIDDGGGWDDVTGETSSPGTATGLSTATEYDFRVAYTDDNETVYSNVVTVTTDAAVGSTLTVTDKIAKQVFQRAPGSTTVSGSKTITFAGSYTGTAPTTIEVEVRLESDSSVVQAYTALSGTSIAGGNWSGTLSVPQGGWYVCIGRSKDNLGSGLAVSSQTTHKWGVGAIILLFGQSNMEKMLTVSATPPITEDRTIQYTTAGGWSAVAGNGDIALANRVLGGANFPVAILNMAVGATKIGAWVADTGGIYSALTTALTAVGGDCEIAGWHQGEYDQRDGTAKATYKGHLDTLYSNLRTATGRNTTTLKFGCALVGTIVDGTATDSTADAIRQGQLEWIAATTGAFYLGSSVDMVLTDAYHWTAPYYERMGCRYAVAVLKEMGFRSTGAGGPQITSGTCVLGSSKITLHTSQDGGTALREVDGSTDGGGLTGFHASVDDYANLLTISSTAFNGTDIELNLSAPLSTLPKVRYQYGETPVITNPVYDDQTIPGDTFGMPLRPTTGSIAITEAAALVGGVFSSPVIRAF